MKKYLLPVVLIIIGIALAIVAATGGLLRDATMTWILAALFVGLGCWLIYGQS
jgi:VIT1/CCC1 family predicted Fe2+/Mn2+ transporter